MRDVTDESVDEAASEKQGKNSPPLLKKTAGGKSSSKLALLKQFFRPFF